MLPSAWKTDPPGCAPWTDKCMVPECHPTALSSGQVVAAHLLADGKALLTLRTVWQELEQILLACPPCTPSQAKTFPSLVPDAFVQSI